MKGYFLKTRTQFISRSMSRIFLLLFTVTTLLSSCGNKKGEGAEVAPEGMNKIDLSRYGKPFSLFVPDTIKAKLTISEQPSGALEVKVGNYFGVAINEGPGDLDLLKRDLKEDEVNRFRGFIKEEPSALLWESEVVHPEYHFFMNKKIGQTEYSFEDIKSTEAAPFTKDAVIRMYDACKNTHPIQKS
jgi:hypothetical protein